MDDYDGNCLEDWVTTELSNSISSPYSMVSLNDAESSDSLTAEIMQLLNERLAIGRSRYGHGVIIDEDPSKYGVDKNDWQLMALEEMLDGLIYSAAAIIRIQRKGSIPKTTDDNDEILQLLNQQLTAPVKEKDNLILIALLDMLNGFINATMSVVKMQRIIAASHSK